MACHDSQPGREDAAPCATRRTSRRSRRSCDARCAPGRSSGRVTSCGDVVVRKRKKMRLGLEGKVVFITGGTKSIGFACARAFAAEGARVSISSRSKDNLGSARTALEGEGFQVMATRADFSNAGDAQAAVTETEKRLGPIDVLINSAGAAKRRPWEKLDADAWRQG